ncbi:Hypothetical protein LEPBI_I2236 [Leptospira biflexa serovar Patoc strain 'Patoc 1 (Paris)']|uniref:Uncharacterized protein n=1 Tax=Leptospira biflexa serovar Patoc (strain Patoc 1 / ATCC 23582 / Paris) TaxID=456481 RepID=B0ST93_LEPBP|nr:Hypothetical protein LEPBI_I2236 [Leptospira biflexa serovar Patoc strain 'Patoc 1 (Paris)']
MIIVFISFINTLCHIKEIDICIERAFGLKKIRRIHKENRVQKKNQLM